jgi:hypothetical protein
MEAVALSAALGLVPPPPAQYDHAYRGQLTIQYLSAEQIRRVCWGQPNIPYTRGCTPYMGAGRCRIVVLRGLPEAIRQSVIRHEIGHCNCRCNWHAQ